MMTLKGLTVNKEKSKVLFFSWVMCLVCLLHKTLQYIFYPNYRISKLESIYFFKFSFIGFPFSRSSQCRRHSKPKRKDIDIDRILLIFTAANLVRCWKFCIFVKKKDNSFSKALL